MPGLELPSEREEAAYREGWHAGLALGALAIAGTAFINLLSVEKSLLAIVLALLAMRRVGSDATRQRGKLAVAVAATHLALAALLLSLFHDKVARLLSLLQALG